MHKQQRGNRKKMRIITARYTQNTNSLCNNTVDNALANAAAFLFWVHNGCVKNKKQNWKEEENAAVGKKREKMR